jgi:hypothetical protein
VAPDLPAIAPAIAPDLRMPAGRDMGGWGYYGWRTLTRAYVYDIADRGNIRVIREVDAEGGYLSSRRIGQSVYLVTSQSVYSLMGPEGYLAPSYRDPNGGEGYVPVPWEEIRYFPDLVSHNYLLITGFNLEDPPGQGAKVGAYLGAGENVYVSTGNVYVATGRWWLTPSTVVYKFALNNGSVTYQYKGEVPGTILNQFSMDEHDGFFRVATTEYTRTGEPTNHLYILDESMGLAGKIENIAPGERMYSARFMGNRGYLVTFKTVDPLFAMDLSDPYHPKILGALKIPGYSDYLHPYDEDHLIGFGKDTVETGGGAFYLGMKISMFDVTDVENPREMFTEVIGDRGTDSPLLYNHKALLFSKEKNLLAFPVQLAELPASGQGKVPGQGEAPSQGKVPDYGVFTFQGAYVYTIDMHFGFQLKGRVTHLTREDLLKSGNYGADGAKYVQRILYINDTLYTASDFMLKATGLTDMTEKGSVRLE